MSPHVDLEGTLRGILKRYDRIGFGRRGVLDAEREIRGYAAGLSSEDHVCLRQIVMSWLSEAEADRVTAALHYNLPEHVRVLAIRLCGSVPIPESLPLLHELEAEGVATAQSSSLPLVEIRESLARLRPTC